jgi:isoleucyl-tRNA synthetase
MAEDEQIHLGMEDVEITTEDIPGWTVATQDKLTVALDMTITDELRQEGLARELVNRVQNLRKDTGLEVVDRIKLEVMAEADHAQSFELFREYICSETLAELILVESFGTDEVSDYELTDDVFAKIRISRM